MGLEIESRPSELPYIERVWRSRSDDVGRMTSIATSHWELVLSLLYRPSSTVRA